MINNVVLVGRLTADVDLKATTSGVAVAQFSLAVERTFKNPNGQRDADFIGCVVWRKNAENLATYAHKGSLIGVEGRIQTRSFENKDGKRVYVTEVIVDRFYLLEKKAKTTPDNQPQNSDNNYHPIEENKPKKSNTARTEEKNVPKKSKKNSSVVTKEKSEKDSIQDLFSETDTVDLNDNDLPF
ncbi:single-stranded DNA-binding protein [uncultured Lactobacillus sp.]|uniref:single-stranded DNA-binding protein n=1 Tax=uncultured Lactobacillus sp. TaxID=153152 RepID=UPI00260C5FDB|nr:single-stranded DNA-binding protein [uncultured Lactobacillus sp.]